MLACANTHPDGRIIKLLVLDDREWAIQARDLGAHILLMPSGVSYQEVEVIVIQEGCHGVVFRGEYQFPAETPTLKSAGFLPQQAA